MSNMKEIIQAVAKQQFNAANEMITQKLSEKISDALITRKETVGREFAASVNEEKRDYKTFFNAAMKKFNISSPADLKSEQEKKEFFEYIDKNFKGAEEEMPEPGEPGYVPQYVPQLIRDPRRPIAPYEPTNPVSPKPLPIDPDNPDVIPYMPIPGFIEDPFTDPNNPDRDPTRPLSTPPVEGEAYGSEEELMGALQKLMGGSKKKEELRKFQTPGQQDIEQGKMSSPFQLKGFKGKGQAIFTDPAGPVAQNPVEQPGDANPYKSGSAEVRDPAPKGNPQTVGDIDVESDRKRGEFGLGTGAIPAQRKIAGSMTTTDLDRSKKDYDLEDEEEMFGRRPVTPPETPRPMNPGDIPNRPILPGPGRPDLDPPRKPQPNPGGPNRPFLPGPGRPDILPAPDDVNPLPSPDFFDPMGDHDGDGRPNYMDPDHPYYNPGAPQVYGTEGEAYDDEEEELGADAIGSPEARAKRPVEDDPVFKVAKTLDADDGLETDDPFRTTMKLKKRRRA